MPVVLDLDAVIEEEKPDYDKGVPLDFEGQTDVVLTKFITTNPNKACWMPDPDGEWYEELTTDLGGGKKSVRVGVVGDNGKLRSVNVDDGLIFRIDGKMVGLVGLLPGRPPMGPAEVDAYVDQNDHPVPMYQQWDFRVTNVVKTNGPQEREKMHRSDDQKRINSQEDMYRAFQKMFDMGAGKFGGPGEEEGTPKEVLAAGIEAAIEEDGVVGFSSAPLPEHISETEKAESAAAAVEEGIQTE